MINSADQKKQILVSQYLFGYLDGHRLLASSDSLSEEASSILLLMSDLVAGVNLSTSEGYWTGFPLPSEKSYALTYTWPAQEMPRPGCVWSHSLIISFSDMASFSDLTTLTNHFVRPIDINKLETYCSPISVSLLPPNSKFFENSNHIDEKKALRVIRAIYDENKSGEVIAPLGSLDKEIFSVWSQQWPRLRRSFSFRTACNLNEIFNIKNKFDLLVSVGPEVDQVVNIEPWEKLCVQNLGAQSDSDYRKFLWRYGTDIRNGKSQLKFLTNLYIKARINNLEKFNINKVFRGILNALPKLDNGRVLKTDMLEGNQYSLIPSMHFLDAIAIYLDYGINTSELPALPQEKFNLVNKLWVTQSDEILSLGELAASRETEVGNSLLQQLSYLVDADRFMLATMDKPNLRHKLLVSTPSLLDTDNLTAISSTDLEKLIQYIPCQDKDLILRVLHRLFVVDDNVITDLMVERFPDITFEFIVSQIEYFFDKGGIPIARSWMNTVMERPYNIVNDGYIERAQTLSSLSFFASVLKTKLVFHDIVGFGPLRWANGLANARDNLNNLERHKFFIFLLKLALANPSQDCEVLFETTFEEIDDALKLSTLNWEQVYELQEYLPNLGWFSNWDNCLRLKIAVVDAYVKNDLRYESFIKLTKNVSLHNELIDLLESSKEGRKYRKKYVIKH